MYNAIINEANVMKKLLYLTILLTSILTINLSARIKSTAVATGMDKSVTLHLPAAYNNEYVYCGSILGTADGNPVKFYCVDISHLHPWIMDRQFQQLLTF